MILSIVIPTHNRWELLQSTISNLAVELNSLEPRIRNEIEVVVVDNASSDRTKELSPECLPQGIKHRRYDQKVEIGASIRRAIEEANHEYVWVMGDDDFFQNGLLSVLIGYLKTSPGVAIHYFNRLVLDMDMRTVKKIVHESWDQHIEEIPMSDFIRRFSHWPGFITAMVFSKAAYENGRPFDREEFEGWEFLARIYYGGRAMKAKAYGSPVIWQRLGIQAWKANWPKYWLVNMPRMLKELENAGATTGALEQWRNTEVSFWRIAIDAIVAKAFCVRASDTFWGHAMLYQKNSKRAVLFAVKHFVHWRVARFAYRLQTKYRQ